MKRWNITAVHKETGKSDSFSLFEPTEAKAREACSEMGYVLESIVEGSPESKGWESDAHLWIWSFLIPAVGFLAGTIRLAQRDKSGTQAMLAALGGLIGWGLALWAFYWYAQGFQIVI